MSRVDLIIIGGFLGAGKTTSVKGTPSDHFIPSLK